MKRHFLIEYQLGFDEQHLKRKYSTVLKEKHMFWTLKRIDLSAQDTAASVLTGPEGYPSSMTARQPLSIFFGFWRNIRIKKGACWRGLLENNPFSAAFRKGVRRKGMSTHLGFREGSTTGGSCARGFSREILPFLCEISIVAVLTLDYVCGDLDDFL